MITDTAQRSAMLALDFAGDWMSAHGLHSKEYPLLCLVKIGMATKSVGVERGKPTFFYRLTDAGRDWCKTNFTDVLTGMINEAEK